MEGGFTGFNPHVQREVANVLFAADVIDGYKYRELLGDKLSPPEGKYLEIQRLKVMAIKAIDSETFEGGEDLAASQLIKLLWHRRFEGAEEQVMSMIRLNFEGAVSTASMEEIQSDNLSKFKRTTHSLIDYFQGFADRGGPRKEALQGAVSCFRAAFLVAESQDNMTAEQALEELKQRNKGGRE